MNETREHRDKFGCHMHPLGGQAERLPDGHWCDDPIRLYIAGPMTHIPQFNFPAFDAMAATLREVGYDVVSPAELDDPTDRAAALASPDGSILSYGQGVKKTWGQFLARDVLLIADGDAEGPIDGIVVLPGWGNSRGARLETFVGRMLCDKTVYRWDGRLVKVGMLELAQGWIGVALRFHMPHPFDKEKAA